MPRISSTLSACCFFLLPLAAPAHVFRPMLPDSLGVVVQQNKTFVRHRVAPGETLYGLARRYKVSVEQIMEANPGIKGALVTGQEVLIPRVRAVLPAASGTAAAKPAAPAASASARSLPTDAAGNHVYKVQPGQTLFAVARKFGVSASALQKYNSKQLPANGAVKAGQTLIIVPAGGSSAPEAVAAAPAPKPAPPTARPERDDEAEKERAREREAERAREAEKARETAAAPASSPVASTPTTPTPAADADEEKEPARASEIVRKVTESGIAAVIEGGNSEKYLALHKTAPVGTIMMVRNIMNGQVVYVRVIGKLPDTGDNNAVLIRLSKKAVAKLNTPDQRFRVETSYLPE
ncbi:LysM peptidoglycan-binding domain-containing protein [Hymenobacter sp. 15J16-1T3B]|uniref:LysM peptidoglycan-binding domain-containing protein n=1 Tax=Hymenobacter sp. 15J16-1T3B TaxID=2886941 RepID=UPI001D0FFCD1|nr:LysM peptidoglycan-binding domain-containing protein [Hymenobacter sp. 15J16-1T3B]MCC3160073.1 LysM peptidoglycan-binding domain-containing protein [Hymenobacter sp. 15J16-1T3B]